MSFSGNITLAKEIAKSGGGVKPTETNFKDITGDLTSNVSAHSTLQRMLNTQDTYRPADKLYRFITNVAPINDKQKVTELCYLYNSNIGVTVDINHSYSNNYKQFTGDFFMGKKIYCIIGNKDVPRTGLTIATNVDQLISFTGFRIGANDNITQIPTNDMIMNLSKQTGTLLIACTADGLSAQYTIKFTER